MSSTARKRAIVEAAVPEIASVVAEGLEDAARLIAGGLCQIAAGMHTNTPGDQRNFAAVLFADVEDEFGDVHRKLDPKMRADLEKYIAGICKGKK